MSRLLKVINNKIILIKIILLFIIINCYSYKINVCSIELNLINNGVNVVENTKINEDYKKVTPKYMIQNLKNIKNIDESEEKIIVARKNIPAKIVYLTFDDGPSQNTSKVLDILKENDIRATFFVNGKPGYCEIYNRMHKEGHCIGNHTYSHDYNIIYSSVDAFKEDINKLNTYLNNMGINNNKILRFPGGSNNTISHKYGGKKIMNDLTASIIDEGYEYYDWDVDSGDASGNNVSKEIIVNNIKRQCQTRKSATILMHDSSTKKSTVEALPEIIAYLKNQGYEFRVIVSEDTPVVHFQ